MRAGLTSGALVEGAVTLAAALLMTFAGFEVAETAQAPTAHAKASRSQPEMGVPVPPNATAAADRVGTAIAMPHVDELRC
jgi:hypothetical protein